MPSESQIKRAERDQERIKRREMERVIRSYEQAQPIEEENELKQSVAALASSWGLKKKAR